MTESSSGDYALFTKYAEAIARLPSLPERSDVLGRADLRLAKIGRVEIHYAPVDFVNEQAKVVIVGVTPGWQQARIAYAVARQGLAASHSPEDIGRAVKDAAAFAGGIRSTLIKRLDGLGLHGFLGIPSSAALFGTHRHLLHTTSAIRYPAFVDGKNYTGHKPKLAGRLGLNSDASRERELLRVLPQQLLGQEVQRVPDAFVVLCGEPVEFAVKHLLPHGTIDKRRCLWGFPHPSGSYAQGPEMFRNRFEDLQRQVRDWFTRST